MSLTMITFKILGTKKINKHIFADRNVGGRSAIRNVALDGTVWTDSMSSLAGLLLFDEIEVDIEP